MTVVALAINGIDMLCLMIVAWSYCLGYISGTLNKKK
jgi:hypothetical protein